MKVLLIGSGGREHAIAYTLIKSNHVNELHALPGNPGISKIGKCIDGKVDDLNFILNLCKQEGYDLIVVGPEVPLCLGLADLLEENGFKVFGPRKQGAMLEGSKAFSKQFMIKNNIPTAKYIEINSFEEGIAALNNFEYPVVVKADGLAAGKGVIICDNKDMAIKALDDLMNNGILDNAGKKVIIEEFLKGYECSLLCFTDGDTIVPMVTSKDHKQIFDGNIGPNTGGMGTVSPNPFFDNNLNFILEEEVLKPFLKGLANDNIDFRGVIFIGLMIDNNKPKVLEFNVRFGDPETQSILLRLDTDLYEIMNAVAMKKLKNINIKWNNNYTGCLVLASSGYPDKYEKGKVITGLETVDNDIVIFHAGTKLINNQLVTNGGRVLNICTSGKNLNEVREKIYKAAEKINFDGKYYRKDIGLI